MLRTLGIDLAAQPKKTAACGIQWISELALVELPKLGLTDDGLLDEMERADWIAIDAPTGWPDAMVAAITEHHGGQPWPADATPETLRYRRTDWFVHDFVLSEVQQRVRPPSVSSDRVAVCAWRCARLLSQYAAQTGRSTDRVGVPVRDAVDGPPGPSPPAGPVAPRGIVEVYPAAALALWGLPFRGYKANGGLTETAARSERIAILARLERLAGAWLILSEDVREACIESDDAFDSFIASLVACAAATGATIKPRLEDRGAAQREGWIHLPEPNGFESLAPAAV